MRWRLSILTRPLVHYKEARLVQKSIMQGLRVIGRNGFNSPQN
jgi:hypothetical protein